MTISFGYVEYKGGERARWYFDQFDGLPRRVDRLYLNEGKESARTATITHLQVNQRLDDEIFRIGIPANRSSSPVPLQQETILTRCGSCHSAGKITCNSCGGKRYKSRLTASGDLDMSPCLVCAGT